MRLNHLDLAVPDVGATRDFFVQFLGFSHVQTLGQDGLAILRDDDGLTLVLSRLRRTGVQAYPDGFHIGFHLSDDESVVALHERLLAETTIAAPKPEIQRGALGFYFTAPGDILVEVASRG
jgi:catechol 2,3-dioxygenase-like lactoylglutathione lyase family enzyme